MKKLSKLFATLLVSTIALSPIATNTAFAVNCPAAPVETFDGFQTNSICFSEGISSESLLSESIDNFNNCALEDYTSYNVANIMVNDLDETNTEQLLELVDNGMVLCLKGQQTISQIYDELQITEEPQSMSVSGAEITGYFIFNVNNTYSYGVLAEVQMVESPIQPSAEEASAGSSEANICSDSSISDAVFNFRRGYFEHCDLMTEPSTVYLQLPNKSFNGSPYYSYLTLKTGSTTCGSIALAQYRYDICAFKQNGITKVVTDVVGDFTISPATNGYVSSYRAVMHSNISNMSVIGQSYLNSNSSNTYTLAGNIGFSGDALTGEIGGSTSNTYSTNNQAITNTFVEQKVKKWTSVPTSHWTNASWTLEPAIRIRNDDATHYQNQAYTNIDQATIYVSSISRMYTLPQAFETGGSW